MPATVLTISRRSSKSLVQRVLARLELAFLAWAALAGRAEGTEHLSY